MAALQNNVCAICHEVCSSGRALAVDHNHNTQALRGLLCTRCNLGIGKFKDNADILRRAAEYLEYHERNPNQKTAIKSYKRDPR